MRSAGINLFMGFSRVDCGFSKEKIEKQLVSLGPFPVAQAGSPSQRFHAALLP
jgi:hypothetical protein